MGNRLDRASPRHGKPRELGKEREARERYLRRHENRPRQRWDWNPETKTGKWVKG